MSVTGDKAAKMWQSLKTHHLMHCSLDEAARCSLERVARYYGNIVRRNVNLLDTLAIYTENLQSGQRKQCKNIRQICSTERRDERGFVPSPFYLQAICICTDHGQQALVHVRLTIACCLRGRLVLNCIQSRGRCLSGLQDWIV